MAPEDLQVDDSVGLHALGVVTPFFVLAILVFSVRIYTRITPVRKLDATDYTNSVAVVSNGISMVEWKAGQLMV